MSIRVEFPALASRPYMYDADGNLTTTQNPNWPFIIEAQSWGVPRLIEVGDVTVLRNVDNTRGKFPLSMALSLVANSQSIYGEGNQVEVFNYPAWVEVDLANKDDSVPAGVSVNDIVVTPAVYDEDGNETSAAVTRRPTYAELNSAVERDGKLYASLGNGSSYIPATEWVTLNAETGVTVIALSDVPAAPVETP